MLASWSKGLASLTINDSQCEERRAETICLRLTILSLITKQAPEIDLEIVQNTLRFDLMCDHGSKLSADLPKFHQANVSNCALSLLIGVLNASNNPKQAKQVTLLTEVLQSFFKANL